MTIDNVIDALVAAKNAGSGANDPVLFYLQSGQALSLVSGVRVPGSQQFLPVTGQPDEAKFVVTFANP